MYNLRTRTQIYARLLPNEQDNPTATVTGMERTKVLLSKINTQYILFNKHSNFSSLAATKGNQQKARTSSSCGNNHFIFKEHNEEIINFLNSVPVLHSRWRRTSQMPITYAIRN